LSRSDEQRFRELYDRTYDRVWAFVMRRTPDEEAAADVVSETFLAVWRRVRDVPADARKADAWVFGTARRVLANWWRGTRRRGRLFERIRQRPVDLLVDLSGPDDPNHSVMQALSQLRPDQREILSLAFWEELETDQIALVLGCSKNAAAVRLTRARQAWQAVFQAMPSAGRTEDGADNGGGER
jgi:RNA polymerase sigma factor (sigma-70 family)